MIRTMKLILLCCFICKMVVADPEWFHGGLKGIKVNCILKTKSIYLAGTGEGLFVNNGNWDALLDESFPVSDIEDIGENEIVIAVASENPQTSGIYHGTPLNRAPYYQIERIDTMYKPRTLAVKGENGDTVFTGNEIYIGQTIRQNNGKFGSIEKISLPPKYQPSECTRLHYFSGNGLLYIGTEKYLLKQGPDTLTEELEGYVTSIMEGTILEDTLQIFVGTSDDGIFSYSSVAMEWKNIPVDFSPVNEMIIGYIITAADAYGTIIAAAGDGVYQYQGVNRSWQKIVSKNNPLYHEPLCIGSRTLSGYTVSVGTNNGVYFYANPLDVKDTYPEKDLLSADFSVTQRNNLITLTYTMLERGSVYLNIVDLKGRIMYAYQSDQKKSGIHSLQIKNKDWYNNNSGAAMYLLHMKLGNNHSTRKLILTH